MFVSGVTYYPKYSINKYELGFLSVETQIRMSFHTVPLGSETEIMATLDHENKLLGSVEA